MYGLQEKTVSMVEDGSTCGQVKIDATRCNREVKALDHV